MTLTGQTTLLARDLHLVSCLNYCLGYDTYRMEFDDFSVSR